MPLNDGFVKLYRKMVDWEWYDDIPTFRLFLHLLITANWKDEQWHGITINRGQRLCSLSVLSGETKLSMRQTRTALGHLESTGEVTSLVTPNYRIITLKNYEKYQAPTNETTNERQTTDKPDDKRPTTNEELKEERNTDNYIMARARNIMGSSEADGDDNIDSDDEAMAVYLRQVGDRVKAIMEGNNPGPPPVPPTKEA